jgi:outer membrane protein TolC
MFLRIGSTFRVEVVSQPRITPEGKAQVDSEAQQPRRVVSISRSLQRRHRMSDRVMMKSLLCSAPSLPMMAAMAGLLLLSTGCTVGPDYVKPSTVAPAAYKETKGWKLAEPRDDVLKGAWWEIFNDPQLNELEAQVDISNQNLAAAAAQFRQARAQVRAARAAFFPTVSAGPSVSRSLESANAVGGSSSGKTSPINDYLLSGDVSWELDIWGKVRRSVESSQAAAQASAGDLEATRLSVQAELAQNYFQLRTLDA